MYIIYIYDKLYFVSVLQYKQNNIGCVEKQAIFLL